MAQSFEGQKVVASEDAAVARQKELAPGMERDRATFESKTPPATEAARELAGKNRVANETSLEKDRFEAAKLRSEYDQKHNTTPVMEEQTRQVPVLDKNGVQVMENGQPKYKVDANGNPVTEKVQVEVGRKLTADTVGESSLPQVDKMPAQQVDGNYANASTTSTAGNPSDLRVNQAVFTEGKTTIGTGPGPVENGRHTAWGSEDGYRANDQFFKEHKGSATVADMKASDNPSVRRYGELMEQRGGPNATVNWDPADKSTGASFNFEPPGAPTPVAPPPPPGPVAPTTSAALPGDPIPTRAGLTTGSDFSPQTSGQLGLGARVPGPGDTAVQSTTSGGGGTVYETPTGERYVVQNPPPANATPATPDTPAAPTTHAATAPPAEPAPKLMSQEDFQKASQAPATDKADMGSKLEKLGDQAKGFTQQGGGGGGDGAGGGGDSAGNQQLNQQAQQAPRAAANAAGRAGSATNAGMGDLAGKGGGSSATGSVTNTDPLNPQGLSPEELAKQQAEGKSVEDTESLMKKMGLM